MRGLACFLLGYLCYHASRSFDGQKLPVWAATVMEVVILVWIFAIFRHKHSGSVDLQAVVAGCGLLVVYSYGRGLVSLVLRTPPFQWLGAISFGLYLVHRPIEHALEGLGFGEPPLFIYLPLVLIVATALEAAVERLMRIRRPLKQGSLAGL